MKPGTLSLNFPEAAMDALADEIASRVVDRLRQKVAAENDGWMTSREAALYLGLSVSSLHKLTAARVIPFEQSGKGARCFFKRTELDAWRAL